MNKRWFSGILPGRSVDTIPIRHTLTGMQSARILQTPHNTGLP